MKNFVPHYYNDFHCIADKCKDSCCIGWEIDIDSDTLEKYRGFGGELGKKLSENITVSEDGSDCFKLAENERCPFLNERGLCELILECGEDILCDICRMHPRFVNTYNSRCEIGLGLCCEETARLILTDNRHMEVVFSHNDDYPEEPDKDEAYLFEARDFLFDIIEKADNIEALFGTLISVQSSVIKGLTSSEYPPLKAEASSFAVSSEIDLYIHKHVLPSLEPLNDEWKAVCEKVMSLESCRYDNADLPMYKNLLKYCLFRYYVNFSMEETCPVETAIFFLDAVVLIQNATGMNFIESACLWSKESEYSEENMEIITDNLCAFRH